MYRQATALVGPTVEAELLLRCGGVAPGCHERSGAVCVALCADARESIAIVGHHSREVLAELVQTAACEGIDLSFVVGREGIEVEERHLGR